MSSQAVRTRRPQINISIKRNLKHSRGVSECEDETSNYLSKITGIGENEKMRLEYFISYRILSDKTIRI